MTRAQPDLAIWLVEDNDLYRETTAELIAETDGMSCPVAVDSCEAALDRLEAGALPDIVLMDIGLPGMSGIDGARQVRARVPDCRVIMLTIHEEDDKVFQAICAGASGYLLKPTLPERVVRAIREVHEGAAPINPFIARKVLDLFGRFTGPAADYGLTSRENEILQLMVDGLTMNAIADRLFLSYHTVDTHIRNIYGKLHVRSRSRAVAKAIRERLI